MNSTTMYVVVLVVSTTVGLPTAYSVLQSYVVHCAPLFSEEWIVD